MNTTDSDFQEEWSRVKHIPYWFLIRTFFIVESFLIAPIIIGNILIILSIVRFHRLRTRIYILVGNLAVSDLLIGTVFIPYDLMFLSNEELPKDKHFCLVRHSLSDMLLGASVMNLFAISFERYIAIAYPLKHNVICTWQTLSTIVCFCWIFSVLLTSLPLLGWNNWSENVPCDIELIWPKPYKSLIFLYFASSLLTNFVMYVKVIRTALKQFKSCDQQNRGNDPLRRHQESFCPNLHSSISQMSCNDVQHSGNHGYSQPIRHKIRRSYKKTKVMMILFGVFAICWGPYLLLVIIDTLFLEDNITIMTIRKFLSVFGIVNSGLNWIIFGLKNREFRKAFIYLLRCGRGTLEGSLAVSSSNS